MADDLGGRKDAREADTTGAGGAEEGADEGVLTLVCLTCGKEYFFADYDPPEGMSCERCGSNVFRNFFSPTDGDDAAQDFQDSTARNLDPDDAEGETLPGDVMDPNSQ
jgi:DNA-directed RNA polymerase subunit RPC12/RpoP